MGMNLNGLIGLILLLCVSGCGGNVPEHAVIDDVEQIESLRMQVGSVELIVIHNISQGGVGLLSTHPLKTRTKVRVRIDSPKLVDPTAFLAQVVQCVNHGDG